MKKIYTLGVVFQFAVFMSPHVFAQGSTSEEASVEEIVVTAQRRSENIDDVPIAISVATRDTLQSTNTATFVELASITPGLSAIEAAGSVSPYIRGIGTRTVVPGNDTPTAFYVDGVYIAEKTSLLLTGFNDVQQIEVLRGPQGTLYGRNSTAGAIQVTTREPSDSFVAEIDATAGNELREGQIYLSGPISDGVRASLSGFYRETDDYIDNVNPANGFGDVGDSEAHGVRFKLEADLTDTFSLAIGADYADFEDTSKMAIQPYVGAPLSTAEIVAGFSSLTLPVTRSRRSYAGEVPPLTESEALGGYLKLNWDLENISIQSLTSYRDSESYNQLDLDASPLPILNFQSAWSTDTFTQELLISSNTDSAFSWLGGVYYIDQNTGYDGSNIYIGVPWPFNPADLAGGGQAISNVAHIDIESIAGFFDFSYAFDSGTTIHAGVRYTDEIHDLDDHNRIDAILPDGSRSTIITASLLCTLTPTCSDTEADFSETTYRFVVDHAFSDDLMVFGSFNRGFKSGVYNVSTGSTVEPTEPEILDAFEVGLKASGANDTVRISTSVFWYDYSEMQVAVTDTRAGGTQRVINAASADVLGLDFEMTWLATENLTIHSGLSYFFEAEYDEFDPCDVYEPGVTSALTLVNQDCGGEQLPVTPDYTVFVNLDYSVPLSSGAELQFVALVEFVDDFNQNLFSSRTSIEPPRQDSTKWVNLSAAWHAPARNWYVRVWGKNLTSEDRSQGLFTTTFGYDTAWQREATYGATVGFTLGD